MIKHMPCLVALSTHWAMKGNSTWIRSLYLTFIKKHSKNSYESGMVTKLDRQLCHVFVSFFGLDRAQRSIVFLSFWTCWSRGDHFSHFVRSQWPIDDSSGVGRCYLNQMSMSHRYVSGVLQNDFPQALYILRNLEKFENSIKIHFFIRENYCKFQQFSGKQYKRAKASIDLILHMHLSVT